MVPASDNSLQRVANDFKRAYLQENKRANYAQDALRNIVLAWNKLKPGNYPKDVWETWLEETLKPAVMAGEIALQVLDNQRKN